MRGFRSVLLWLGLVVAFSPVIVDLVRHELANPWARYALWFPLLFARCVRSERTAGTHPSGILWLVLGLALEVFAGFAGTIRTGRLGLALGVMGLGLRFGLASPRALVLAVLAIPVPAAVMSAADPLLPTTLLAWVAEAARALGAEILRDGHTVLWDGRTLSVDRFDSGIPLAVLLAGLSWYGSTRTNRRWSSAIARAAAAALLALPLQMLLIAAAILALPFAPESFCSAWLTHAPALVVAPIGIVAVEVAGQRARSSP